MVHTHNAIVSQAANGKTVVIIDSKGYADKVQSFLTTNNFNTLTRDPTKKFQKLINKTMQECNSIIDKPQIKFLTQKKHSPPVLKAQIKLHKTGIPIRPVINNRTAPAYKLAKHMTKILNQHISLNDHNNMRPLCQCSNIRNIGYHKKILQNNHTQMTQQIMSLLRVVLTQIYFTFQQTIYQHNQGIAIGSPISSLIAEIFL